MEIRAMAADDADLHPAAAALLVEGFREHWPAAWPDLAAAMEEVQEAVAPDGICLAALDAGGELIGWIAGRPAYDGNVWELHPLVVRATEQGRGVGRALVAAFEARVAARGGLTITLGTDDEAGLTSLHGVELFPDVLAQLAGLRNLRRHPYEFYQRCGFAVVGVVPNANGPGKPDILMAKAVRRP